MWIAPPFTRKNQCVTIAVGRPVVVIGRSVCCVFCTVAAAAAAAARNSTKTPPFNRACSRERAETEVEINYRSNPPGPGRWVIWRASTGARRKPAGTLVGTAWIVLCFDSNLNRFRFATLLQPTGANGGHSVCVCVTHHVLSEGSRWLWALHTPAQSVKIGRPGCTAF